MQKPNMIIIMDGYGLAPASKGNAIELEGSPVIKKLQKEYPSTTLGASGMSVGLPEDRWAIPKSDILTWAPAE